MRKMSNDTLLKLNSILFIVESFRIDVVEKFREVNALQTTTDMIVDGSRIE